MEGKGEERKWEGGRVGEMKRRRKERGEEGERVRRGEGGSIPYSWNFQGIYISRIS